MRVSAFLVSLALFALSKSKKKSKSPPVLTHLDRVKFGSQVSSRKQRENWTEI